MLIRLLTLLKLVAWCVTFFKCSHKGTELKHGRSKGSKKDLSKAVGVRRINIFTTSNEHYQIITLLLLFKSLVYSTA